MKFLCVDFSAKLYLASAAVALPVALACTTLAGVHAQGSSTRPLQVGRSVAVTWPGPRSFGVLGSVGCDAAGDLYLRPAVPTGGFLDDATPVVRVSRNGVAGPTFSPYKIPGFQKPDDSVGNFTVDREGRVEFLVRRCSVASSECHEEVDQFGRDGRYESVTTLLGRDFSPNQLAVFPNGRLLAAGSATIAGTPMSHYTAVYSADGTLFSLVGLPNDVPPPSMPAGPSTAGTALSFVAANERGALYLFRPVNEAVLYTINERGNVTHATPIEPPFPDAAPMGIQYAGHGNVILEFSKWAANGMTSTGYFFSMIDTEGGRTLINYAADAKTGGLLGCFVPGLGLEFLTQGADGPVTIRFDPLP